MEPSGNAQAGHTKPKIRIVCKGCGVRYTISREKVKATIIKIRCRKCREVMTFKADVPQALPERCEPAGLFDSKAGLFDLPESGLFGPEEMNSLPNPFVGTEPGIFAAGAGDQENLIEHSETASDPASDAMMTAMRNESSVLFSLSNLKAVAVGQVSPYPETGRDPVSGLIDIRSLTASLSRESDPAGLNEFVSMVSTSVLTAPVLAPQGETAKPWIKVGIAGSSAVFLSAAVLLGLFFLSENNGGSHSEIAKLKETITALQENRISPRDAVTPSNQTPDGSKTPSLVPEKNQAETKPAAPIKTAISKTPKKRSPKKPTITRSDRDAKGSSKRASRNPPQKDSTPPTVSKHTGTDKLSRLLGPSLKEPHSSPRSEKESTSNTHSLNGPPTKQNLDRADVQKGMNGVTGIIGKCGQGKHGTIFLSVVISRTGRILSANPLGPYAGTPQGACAARAVRAARFPKTKNNLAVRYPFKL